MKGYLPTKKNLKSKGKKKDIEKERKKKKFFFSENNVEN